MFTHEAHVLGGKTGGKSRSEAKLAACRANGKLGGQYKNIPRHAPLEVLKERFWANVFKTNDCWFWIGANRSNGLGYGSVTIHGKSRAAHWAAWFFTHGYWPKFLLHSCDIKNCVNPAHLSEGTCADNIKDFIEKGCNSRWPIQ
jgi:hypothetical protein